MENKKLAKAATPDSLVKPGDLKKLTPYKIVINSKKSLRTDILLHGIENHINLENFK